MNMGKVFVSPLAAVFVGLAVLVSCGGRGGGSGSAAPQEEPEYDFSSITDSDLAMRVIEGILSESDSWSDVRSYYSCFMEMEPVDSIYDDGCNCIVKLRDGLTVAFFSWFGEPCDSMN